MKALLMMCAACVITCTTCGYTVETGTTGAGGFTSSTTHFPTINPCPLQVCDGLCGVVFHDCDGDGKDEPIHCANCLPPEACDGSDVPNHCGSKCQSKYSEDCTAAGLPAAWAFDASCQLVYAFDGAGNVNYCAGCASSPGCKPITVNGTSVLCCS